MSMMSRTALAGAAVLFSATLAVAHGDVAPQPVNTDTLPDVGEEWLTENPYRDQGDAVWQAAVDIGSSGYNQNCARCHGLEVISGGLAPDLRFLEAEEYGDEWFVERFQGGYTQNGVTKMPAFGDLLGQKAAWAIRTYIETRPDDAMIDEKQDELKAIRDQLLSGDIDVATTVIRLREIADEIETLSGAPIADSIAYRAANQLDAKPDDLVHAAETLTVGLSAAH